MMKTSRYGETSQYNLLDGKKYRLIPVKVHWLDGLQAAIEQKIEVRCFLCDGLLLRVKNKKDVQTLLERALQLETFRNLKWSEDEWIEIMSPEIYLLVMKMKPTMLTGYKRYQKKSLD